MASLTKRLMGGWTELHGAAANGDLQRVRALVLKSPADIDKVNKVRRAPPHMQRLMSLLAVLISFRSQCHA